MIQKQRFWKVVARGLPAFDEANKRAEAFRQRRMDVRVVRRSSGVFDVKATSRNTEA